MVPSFGATLGSSMIIFTRFERARILGARALQISMGAPALVGEPVDAADPLRIATDELRSGSIPLTVQRGYRGRR